jgi:hypothetical protein
MSEELNDLCEGISDKIMETGLLTGFIEDGSLATVSLRVTGEKDAWTLNIDLVIDDRDSDEISEDEDDEICDNVQMFITSKGLDEEFEGLGFELDNRDSIIVNLVE